MRKLIWLTVVMMIWIPVRSQINMSDSTVQIIGYWNKGDLQKYLITNSETDIKGTDTTSRTLTRYNVDIKIIDSTEDSYTINWFYHDYKIESDNPLVRKLSSIAEDLTVTIKTDEMGIFEEVVNWKDVRDMISKGLDLLKIETSEIPNMVEMIKQIEDLYRDKSTIEASAIAEIQQYYSLFGLKCKIGEEISGTQQLPNIYGGPPLDSPFVLWLDEIIPDEDNYIMRMHQKTDSVQLNRAVQIYLDNMAETMKIDKPASYPALSHETFSASRVHTSGWVIYSVQTLEIKSEDVIKIKENVIELL